jgi:hypothetical protein
MDRMIAYCGLICTDCDAYKATQAGDEAWIERIAAQWREEYHAPAITAASVWCDGCLATSDRLCSHCHECEMRLCGMQKGVANCGACQDYDSCEKVRGFFKFVPGAKIILDEIHKQL